MFAIRVRERPWSDLCAGSSEGRDTVMVAPSCLTVICGCSVRVSSPLGPFTCTVFPVTFTVIPAGTVTGSFPIRDIGRLSLPDVGEEFTAGALLARLAVGH